MDGESVWAKYIVAWNPGAPISSVWREDWRTMEPPVDGAEAVDTPDVGVHVESTGLVYERL